MYSLFIAIDANFRLKLKTRGIKDPELGSGLTYFVNAEKFEAHLKGYADEEDVSIPDMLLFWTESSRVNRSRLAEQNSTR